MKRLMGIFAVAMLLAFSGMTSAAAPARAISIEPTGPTVVYHTDVPTTTYTATITCDSNFWLRLKVYLNGGLQHDSMTFCPNSGPTYNFSKNVTIVQLRDGDVLTYRGRASVGGIYDEEDWVKTVQ